MQDQALDIRCKGRICDWYIEDEDKCVLVSLRDIFAGDGLMS
jgi:hypothetical protein